MALERIIDRQFLRFIKKRLNLQLFDTSTNKYQSTMLGIPQGGIDSPYLWNIYLLGFDQFVIDKVKNILDIENTKRLTSKERGVLPNTLLTTSPINPSYNRIGRTIANVKNAFFYFF
jgi:hypothetical protein